MKTQELLYLCSILIFALLSPGKAQPDTHKIDQIIASYMTEMHIPGMAVSIVQGDTLSWSNAYGWADIKNKKPMQPDGLMNIASISKTITATAIMQLWEEGKLDLDTDINTYLSISIRNPHHPKMPITIRHLLTHTSSIVDGSAYGDSYSCGDPSISLQQWIKQYLTEGGEFYHAKENFLSKKPGSQYKYSNVGYGLLGFIVEEITNISFNQYCREQIFEPLGMKHTGWYIHKIDKSNHAIPHIYVNQENRQMIIEQYSKFFPGEKEFAIDTNIPLCLYSFPNYPDGLLRTNVEELSYFLRAIMNEGVFNSHPLLKKSTIDEMLSLQAEENVSQGLCWRRSDFESLWGHSGGDPGVSTKMYFSRETDIGIILFQNNNEGDQFEMLKEIYKVVMEDTK